MTPLDDLDKKRRSDYASAAEALQILHVRQQTLYAYVSRGWIRSIPQKGLKDKLYLRDDLTRVGMRSLARSGHGAVAASAMNWGEPIFPTSITEITEQGPRYRGKLAADLVRSGLSFEAVAELIWTGVTNEEVRPWPVKKPSAGVVTLTQGLAALQAGGNILESFALIVLLLGMQRVTARGRSMTEQTLPAARELIQTLVACCGFTGAAQTYRPLRKGETVVEGLMHALAMPVTTQNSEALRSILILMADHELPPGTLSARVVASTGGTLHSCLAAALCATSGADVGRMFDKVQDFLGRPRSHAVLVQRAQRLHAQGQAVPGFDHPLYAKGDPRASHLLDLARLRQDQGREQLTIFRFIDEMCSGAGLFPRQELAIVVLARAMGLSRQAPAALFALARLAGWVAHVQEQRAAGTLMRPRAKFVAAI
jgi:citrate synthase